VLDWNSRSDQRPSVCVPNLSDKMIQLILVLIGVVSVVYYLFKSLLFKSKRKLAPGNYEKFISAYSVIQMLKLKPLSLAGPIIWPLIGNVLELAATDLKYPHLALVKLAKKYGNIVGFGFGSQYSVLLSGYEEMKELLRKPELCEFRFVPSGLQDRNLNQNLGK